MRDAPIKLRKFVVDQELVLHSLLYILAGLCIISLILLIAYFVRARRMKQVADKVDELGSRFYPVLERVQAVEEHAVDYANSLDSESLVCLDELQKMVRTVKTVLFEVESRLESGDFREFKDAELFLTGKHPRQLGTEQNFDGGELSLRIDPDWERHMERLLQIIGKSVSHASLAATEIGVPKRRKRKATLISLFRAGIKMDKGPYQA